MKSEHLKNIFLALSIAILVYVIHSSSRNMQSIDSAWALPTALSLVNEGNFDLNEYRKLVKSRKNYGVRIRPKSKKIYNFFPYGTSLVILPFVAIFETNPDFFKYLVPDARKELKKKEIDTLAGNTIAIRLPLERALASLIIAITSIFWFFIARKYLNLFWSATLVLFFAFGTPAWSTASRGLWQHGPILLLISSSLTLLLYKPKFNFLSAFPYTLGYIVRPTMSLFWGLTFLLESLKRRRTIVYYLLISLSIITAFCLTNLEIWKRPLPPYFKPGRLGYHDGFFQAFFASLFSPNRGLFFQSPFLLFSFFSLPLIFKENKDRLIVIYCHLAFFLHLTATSLFPNWWHGHCFGSRYMTDILPFLFLLICISSNYWKSKIHKSIFITLAIFSTFVHYQGATNYSVYQWNIRPINIDKKPSRVWSLSDWQPMRSK